MLIKFFTEGCSPCYALSLVLDEKMIPYSSVDINKDMDSAIAYRVMSVPTLLNTDTNARLVGFKDKETLEKWLNDNQD